MCFYQMTVLNGGKDYQITMWRDSWNSNSWLWPHLYEICPAGREGSGWANVATSCNQYSNAVDVRIENVKLSVCANDTEVFFIIAELVSIFIYMLFCTPYC